jgi:CDP-paratose 2-epimerase
MKNRFILITGAAGLVGQESANFFLKKNYFVLGIDNNQRKILFGKDGDTSWIKKKLLKNKRYSHYNANIILFEDIKKIFKKYNTRISLVIHAAAQPSHDWAYRDPGLDFEINAKGTLNVLEATRLFCPRAKFIFISTNKVYGDRPNFVPLIESKDRYDVKKTNVFFEGVNETMSIDNCTHSLFGVSKLYADTAVQEYGKNFGLNTVVFRAGCITGPAHSSAKLHGFLSFLVKSCLKDKKYSLIGYKGKQVRDNIHSYDLVNCFWQFYKYGKKKGEVYNIGGGRKTSCSIVEAINYLETKVKFKIKKIFIKKNRVGDHKWYISSNKKFKKDFPKWRQKYNFTKIMNELIDLYR